MAMRACWKMRVLHFRPLVDIRWLCLQLGHLLPLIGRFDLVILLFPLLRFQVLGKRRFSSETEELDKIFIGRFTAHCDLGVGLVAILSWHRKLSKISLAFSRRQVDC